MLVVLLCFGLVPLVAMGIAGFMANRAAMQTRMRNVLEAMVKNRLATIDLFLAENMRQLEFAAFSHSIKQLSNPEIIESLRAEMQRDHGAIVDLGLINESGLHVAYAGPYKL